ncbi:hypothetical protein K466DRAFT_328313 [Polyporus arcularius HHB13444]|uniref:Uncharacterized protein n=1 Tax=Polyporus arcularius HHB13444 TaxID=1314778 RepID=A0A5C3P084_9APHY|nr:hypothetical protein K466DRAFT_328313 [Polyporus arcularius HHB13444]
MQTTSTGTSSHTHRNMNAVSNSSEPLPNLPPRPVQEYIPQGPSPTLAYGIVIDEDCIYRHSKVVHKEMNRPDLSHMSPEDANKALRRIRGFTIVTMPDDIYFAFPNLPRLKRNLLLMRDVEWLFVFKDNSTHAASHVYLDPEDVRGVKRMLGLQWQVAKWHRVSQCML